jgi:hypothetical protein
LSYRCTEPRKELRATLIPKCVFERHRDKYDPRHPGGLALTLMVTRLIKPFTMAGLGVLFF